MYEANSHGIHRNLSAVLAAAVVAISGLVFDRAHLASAPEGSIEVGQLVLTDTTDRIAALPEVVVSARPA